MYRLRLETRNFIALLAALLACVPAAFAQTQSAASPPPRPAIWLLEDEDTKIYLFGTTHVFPASLRWRSPALDRVVGEADELVMELADVSSEPSQAMIAAMATSKPSPILERVSPAARPRLRTLLKQTGMPPEFFDNMHSWAVAFFLTGFQIMQNASAEDRAAGAEALSGAEEELSVDFTANERPISGIETMEEQLGIFATMSPAAQSRFLEMTVTGGVSTDRMTPVDAGNAWAAGDVEAIAAEMAQLPPDVYEALLTRRNRAWTGWLVRRLDRPGVVLFAVGAGHLAGPESVQRMLAARGLTTRRID